jgi:hypothetical protein
MSMNVCVEEAKSGNAMTATGRQRWLVTIGCSRSAPKLSQSSVGMRERPQSLTFLAVSAKVKFQGRPVVR